MTQGIKLDPEIAPSTISRRVARRKALGAGRKGCWGFLVGSRTFCPEKNAEIGDLQHLQGIWCFFCAILFQHQKFQQKLPAKWSSKKCAVAEVFRNFEKSTQQKQSFKVSR